MSNLEDQLLHLLAETQSSQAVPRKSAEAQLESLGANENFPISLAAIAAHTGVSIASRQAALTTLRQFVEKNWSGEDEETEGPAFTISDEIKDALRSKLLELATSEEADRKVRTSARYASH